MVKRTAVPDKYKNTGPTATEPQLDYLRKLRDGKDLSQLTPEQIAWLQDADFDTFPSELPKLRMSQVIEQLKGLPWVHRGRPEQGMPEVPNGRYAVEKEDGTLMFYSVKKGEYKTFVDVWASDARWPIQNGAERKRVLEAIAVDPKAAMIRFGEEIGRCGRCGRTLTRETSRIRGLGPDCADLMSVRHGW